MASRQRTPPKRYATPPTTRHESPNWQQKQQAQSNSVEMDDALSDVELKFIMNLPATELQTSERLFFQIEQAHWYYEDFLVDAPQSRLPSLNLRTFALRLFEFSELLAPLRSMYDEFFKDFMEYKGKIPTYGCILLNPQLDKMVLVCNWKGTSWGFPKGKLNEGENGAACAVREVEEETGFRAMGPPGPDGVAPSSASASTAAWLPPEEDSITVVLDGGQRTKMFIVPGVPEDSPFEPQVRKEISKIQFFPFDEVPKKAWNVSQFVPALRRWVKDRRRKLKALAKKQQAAASKNNHPTPPRHPNKASARAAAAAAESATPPRHEQRARGDAGGGEEASSAGGLSASVASLFGGSGGGFGESSSAPTLAMGVGNGPEAALLPVEASVNGHGKPVHTLLKPGGGAGSSRRQGAATAPPSASTAKANSKTAQEDPFEFDVLDIMAAIDHAAAARARFTPSHKNKSAARNLRHAK